MTTAEQPSQHSTPVNAGWRVKRHHAALVLLALMCVVAIRARWFSGASQAAPGVDPPASTAAAPASNAAEPSPVEPTPAESTPAEPTLLGIWRDQYYGERTMTFEPGGKGTMLIKLDAVGQAIYGEKLLFHLDWENVDGVLVMTFTGGEPKDAVATISKLWGAKHEQKIELLTESELHLRSTDSQNLYKHQRLESGAASK